jgi:hypothetical protein
VRNKTQKKRAASKRQKEMRKMWIDFFQEKEGRNPEKEKNKKKTHPQPYLFFFFFLLLLLLLQDNYFFFSTAHNWVPDSCVR